MQPVHSTKILIDIFIFILSIAAWILVDLYLPRKTIGFECDDYSISLPFKESTVKNNIQIIISIFLPIMLIAGTEIMRRFYISYKSKVRFVYKVNLCGKVINVPDTLGSLYINIGAYFFGLIVVSLIVSISKYTVGRLRPHYLEVCQPIYLNNSKPDCNVKRYYQLKIDYICKTKNIPRLDEASLSFPSQISAFVFYTSTFLCLYMRYTWKYNKFGLLTPFLQSSLISISTFIAATRVSDYKHFMSDVIAGVVLGTVAGVISFYSLTDFIKTNNKDIIEKTSKHLSENNPTSSNTSNEAIATHKLANIQN